MFERKSESLEEVNLRENRLERRNIAFPSFLFLIFPIAPPSSFNPFPCGDVDAIILERTVHNGILHGPLKKR